MKRQDTLVHRAFDDEKVLVPRTFDGLGRQQLLIYARELAKGFHEQQTLQHTLFQREQQLQEMTAAFIHSQEEQYQWIACEVHDSVVQTLASIHQQLQVLESTPRLSPKVRHSVVRVSVLLRQAIREIRSIMNTLHPPGLDDLGIVPVIEQELSDFQRDTGCSITFDAKFSVRPCSEVEVALYRIFHEALMNVKKHATSAGNVTISLVSSNNIVSLQVQDDGPGFNIKASMQDKRIGGLMTMRRRAEITGGTFKVTSIYGRGVRINVRIPINGRNWKRKASS